MANKKIICTGCRRSYDNKIEFCPYCSAPNPLLQSKDNMAKEEGLSKAKPKKAAPKPKPEEPQDEYDEDELFGDTETEEAAEEPDDEYVEDTDEESDEYEEYEDSEDDEDEEAEDSDDSDEYEEDDEDESEDDEEYEDDKEDDEEEDDEDDVATALASDSKRSPIDWTDEEKKEKPDMSKAYDENGGYNPNFDGYYNDTKAKIDGEIESLTAGKEKAILKVVLGIAAVIGVIVYLVLTLY